MTSTATLPTPRSRWSAVVDAAIICLPLLVYVYYAAAKFWMYPPSSDPMEYLLPIHWHDMSLIQFPGRLMVSLGMYFSNAISAPLIDEASLRMGAFHPLLVNCLCMIFASFYCYRRAGFVGGLLCMIVLSTSYTYVRYSNDSYPDLEMTLYGMLACIFLAGRFNKNILINSGTLCGLFATFLLFSKSTAIATFFVIVIFVIIYKAGMIRLLLGMLIGLCVVALLSLLAFDHSSIPIYISDLLTNTQDILSLAAAGRYNLDISVFNALTGTLLFPALLAPIVLSNLWKRDPIRLWFSAALAHVLLLTLLIVLLPTIRAKEIYFHSAITFAGIGLAIGMGQMFHAVSESSGERPIMHHPLVLWLFAIGLAAIVLLALQLGLTNVDWVLHPTHKDAPVWARNIFVLMPLALLLLLLLINNTCSKLAVSLFLLIVAFWSPYQSIGHASRVIAKYQASRACAMDIARHFNDAIEPPLGVHITGFEDDRLGASRLLYTVFFDDGHLVQTPPQTVYPNDEMNQAVIHIADLNDLKNVRYLIVDQRGRDELVDQGVRFRPVADWKSSEVQYYTLELLDCDTRRD